MSADSFVKRCVWILDAYYPWSSVQTAEGRPITADEEYGVGFMPVFDSLEEAKKRHPGRKFTMVVIPGKPEAES